MFGKQVPPPGVDVSEDPAVTEAQQRYNQSAFAPPYQLRSPDQLASFFDGLDLVEPGVVPCARWRPDVPVPGGSGDDGLAWCGVGRKGI